MRFSSIIIAVLLAFPALAQDIRVIDGDTFELDGEVIRLWGIDAPELDQTCEIDGVKIAIGQEPATYLDFILQYEFSHCDRVDVDRYGRTVARCFTDSGEDIGAAMVLAGGAWDYPRYSGGAYAEEEAEVRGMPGGVWLGDCIPPWEWREQNSQ